MGRNRRRNRRTHALGRRHHGPGTKLSNLCHTSYDYLQQTFALQAESIIDGGVDAFLIETSQDLPQINEHSPLFANAVNVCD
jgi:5-methyltetrahydrofolate--homocysteine methyltransferase